MNGAVKDRRVRKTKQALQASLIKLMAEKDVQAITVKELCAECDINRGTFYLHYTDVSALLLEIEDETLMQMEEMMRGYSLLTVDSEGKPSPILRIMFTFLAENADLCRVMLSPHGDSAFVEKVKEIVRVKFMEEWKVKFPSNATLPSDFVFTFILSGTMGILQNWLAGNMPESADKMAEMVEKVIVKGAASAVV